MSYSAQVIKDEMVIDYERLSKEVSLDFLDENGWIAELDSSGNIINIEWDTGCRFNPNDLLDFFEEILPYVEEGSYIYFNGEDGNNVGFFFEDKMVVRENLCLVRERDYELFREFLNKTKQEDSDK